MARPAGAGGFRPRRTPASRRKADYQLRVDRRESVPAESLHKDEAADIHRVFFRLPPPKQATTVELLWRQHTLGQLTLPVPPCEGFISHLALRLPTVFVRP